MEISTSDRKEVFAHCLLIAVKSIFFVLILGLDFYNALIGMRQPDITVLEGDFSSVDANNSSTEARQTACSSHPNITLRVTVPETAAVVEAITDWLYEYNMPRDPEMFADIYKAAVKYNFKEVSSYIVSQIDHLKDDAKFIISMMQMALELKDEDLIKELIPIFKVNDSWQYIPEFKEKLGQHSFQLMIYFMKY